jgi:hypothetical protein
MANEPYQFVTGCDIPDDIGFERHTYTGKPRRQWKNASAVSLNSIAIVQEFRIQDHGIAVPSRENTIPTFDGPFTPSNVRYNSLQTLAKQ